MFINNGVNTATNNVVNGSHSITSSTSISKNNWPYNDSSQYQNSHEKNYRNNDENNMKNSNRNKNDNSLTSTGVLGPFKSVKSDTNGINHNRVKSAPTDRTGAGVGVNRFEGRKTVGVKKLKNPSLDSDLDFYSPYDSIVNHKTNDDDNNNENIKDKADRNNEEGGKGFENDGFHSNSNLNKIVSNSEKVGINAEMSGKTY